MRHIHVNGVELEYVDEGVGLPVVFSHGGSLDLRYWEPQRSYLGCKATGGKATSGDSRLSTHHGDGTPGEHMLSTELVDPFANFIRFFERGI